MSKVIIILLCIIALFHFLSNWGESSASIDNIPVMKLEQIFEGNETDWVPVGTCFKEKCLYIFATPWCGTCRKLKKKIHEFAVMAESLDFESTIVVGDSTKEKILNYSEGLGGRVVMDPQGTFMDAAQVSFFPMYYVTDGEGKIIRGGSIPTSEKRMREAF